MSTGSRTPEAATGPVLPLPGASARARTRFPSPLRATALAAALGAGLAPGLPAGAAPAEGEVPVPEWLAPRITGLSAEQRAFLLSDEAVEFGGGTREKLWQKLRTRDAEEVEAFVAGMMTVVAARRFQPDEDLAAIPLNTGSPFFNGWKVKRPKSFDPPREPGPFSVSYYQDSEFGIATFAGAPVAVYPEDLIAGEVEVAIVGAPLDMGSYMRGQRFGPAAMRNEYGMGGPDMYTMVDPTEVLNVVDYGDIAVDNMSTERTVHHVRERIAEIARTGAIPFIIGGDHSLEYPDIAGLADVHGKGSFGVVHFDSHYDAGFDYSAHFITHGQPVYRAVKEGHVDPRNYVQVGLRGPWPGPKGFEWMRDNGMRYHAMPEVEKRGWEVVMETALAEAREGPEKLFISFDVDVLDPAFVPGTGTPVPGGLTMREAIPIVRRLCQENDIVGFELVELAPNLEVTYRSALNGNFIVHACLTGIAMRKQGIVQPGFLSELTTEHLQPAAVRAAEAAGRTEEIDPAYGRPR
jgi:guanidinobutyrase